jgi:hypothetical protein
MPDQRNVEENILVKLETDVEWDRRRASQVLFAKKHNI